MLKEIMKRAHEIARTLEGHYHARLALALRVAWKEAKQIVVVGENERLIKLGELQKKVERVFHDQYYNGKLVIKKETEKAILVRFTGTFIETEMDSDVITDKTDDFIEAHWLPKSQIRVVGEHIIVPDWLVRKKYMGWMTA